MEEDLRFSAIAGGSSWTLALKSNGTVVAWAYNRDGICQVPPGLTGVVAIAAGGSHNLALKKEGTIVAWGSSGAGQTDIPVDLNDVAAISVGFKHSLALRSNGTVVAWGSWIYGETNGQADLTGVMAIAAGGAHNLALRSNGTVVAWGDNYYGQTNVPADLSGVRAIAAGTYHSVALKSNGTMVVWGSNEYGERNIPPNLSEVAAIAAGGAHSLALRSNGTVVAWGHNGAGQTNVPPGLTNVASVAAGWGHSLALTSNGMVVAWGNNGQAQCTVPSWRSLNAVAAGRVNLGLKSDGTVFAWGYSGEMKMPTDLTGVVAIAAGESHYLALKSNGTVVVWGSTNYFQTNMPAGLNGVAAIAAGAFHSLALKSNGTVVAWGWNEYSQTIVPTSLAGVRAIAAGGNHSLALKSNGTVVAWGATIMPPSDLSGVAAIAAGGEYYPYGYDCGYSLALKSNGTVVAWGHNDSGQTNVPPDLGGVIAIAAGGHHSLALKNDGTIVAWGSNTSGQTNVPTGLTGVVAIAAGPEYSFALYDNPPAPPLITSQPISQTVPVGSTVSFCLTGSSRMPSFSYLWIRDGLPIPEETNSCYSLTNCQLADSGQFSCLVSNIYGTVVSSNAVLIVEVSLPTMLVQPSDQTARVGGSAKFCITAESSTPLSYLWQRDGAPILDATNSCYTITNCQLSDSGSQFSCLVSNASGTVTSSNATLSVLTSISTIVAANPAAHVIQDSTAQPYPSTILVTNVGGIITKLTVTLSNLAHTYPNNLDILLVGPSGQKVMLMSDAVGSAMYKFTNVSLTFSDTATRPLPASGVIGSRAYQPTDLEPGDTMPAPAPAGPYDTNLNVFAGGNANGLWSLYIADDYPSAFYGFLGNGWFLNFEMLQVQLAISLQGTNLVIDWPAATGQLESSDLTAPSTWSTISPQPTIVETNGRNTVTLPVTTPRSFYRLRIE